ncbi:selenocysteine-specific translation elongation factor [candidate division KSB1 bacterium]|nr:selenocysteine-specific translation elongation factor [candidate division KSB1 bacterium]
MESSRHFILGTAGHIDHGKTALVKALTGVDTDRLKEEKARGLTIDLGFAHFGDNATIIDVPGHERFIKNMVAGVSTIDLVLFVIAADDGIMPQTREHLDILKILQVQNGIIVITKKDMVEADWLEMVKEDVRELVHDTALANAEIMAVSAIENDGIDALRDKIIACFESLPPRHNRGVFWLPVDRSFVMKGFGTVVTGSVLSGQIQTGDFVDILPHGEKVRVRGIQKHNAEASLAKIGDRAAINLHGVARSDIARGDVLASAGYFKATRRMHAKLHLLENAIPVKANMRVRLHIGTAEIMARVKPIGCAKIEAGEGGYVQFNLEKPAAARRLDPFVIRQYSPAHTIGGGLVLDANAPPYRSRDKQLLTRLQGLEKEDPEELIAEQFLLAPNGMLSADELVSKTGMASETVAPQLSAMRERGTLLAVSKKNSAHQARVQSVSQNIVSVLEKYHHDFPASPGFRKAELAARLGSVHAQVLQFVVDQLKSSQEIKEFDGFIALADHEIRLSEKLQQAKARVDSLLSEQGFAPSNPAELAAAVGISDADLQTILDVLAAEKRIKRLDVDLYMHIDAINAAKKALVVHLQKNSHITVPEFKALIAGASRKFALPLLNYYDALEITLRQGDVRYPGANIPEIDA